MDYLNGFIDNLGNKYTSILLSFMIGYVIGVSSLGNRNAWLGILIGVLFAVTAGIINSFLEIVMPHQFMVNLNTKFLFTLILLIVFFIVISSKKNLNNVTASLR
jgi:hypothetical protein